jgi:cytochrome c-type biogenesis protein CcmE
MKSIPILLLVLVAVAIAVLISFMGNLSTYTTVKEARSKPGRYVHLVARLDKLQPVEYDAVQNPNYVSFTAVDSLGHSIRVVYRNAKPEHLERSERLVLKGAIKDGQFECQEILMKCPSKYKEEEGYAAKRLPPTS